MLQVGYLQTIFKRSNGGIVPIGWKYEKIGIFSNQNLILNCNPGNNPEMLKFIQLTDLHIIADKKGSIYGMNPWCTLNKVAKQLSGIRDIDCIIITGDMADSGEYEAYLHINEVFSNIEFPIFWLQGNHDFSEVMLQVKNRIKIRSDKSFIIKDTKFILLQTVIIDDDDFTKNNAKGFLFWHEMSFLKRELDENNFRHAVIALHHPPVLSNSWADEKRILDNRDEFISLIGNYPKVKVVLYGHQHIAQHTIIDNIHYISAPAASFQYNPRGERFSLLLDKQGFSVIRIDEQEEVTLENVFVNLGYVK